MLKTMCKLPMNFGRTYVILTFAFVGLLASCQTQKIERDISEEDKGAVIKTYKDKVLYKRELEYFTPDGLSEGDSTKYANDYIRRWLRHQTIEAKAYESIPDMPSRVEYRSEDTRRKIIEQEWKEWLLRTRLDTVVSEVDIRNYFSKNRDKFISETFWYCYFHVKTQVKDRKNIVRLMQATSQAQIAELKRWSTMNAKEFRLDSSYVDNTELLRIAKGFPGNIKRGRQYRVYTYRQREDGVVYDHYFKWINSIPKGKPEPLYLNRDAIKATILAQRKRQLLQDEENGILQNLPTN